MDLPEDLPEQSPERAAPVRAAETRSLRLSSLRSKAVFAFAALIVYAVGLTYFVLRQKESLLDDFEAIHSLYAAEAVLKEIRVAAFHALVSVQGAAGAGDEVGALADVRADAHLLDNSYRQLAADHPEVVKRHPEFGAAIGQVGEYAVRGGLAPLRTALQGVVNGSEELSQSLRHEAREMVRLYRLDNDSLTIMALVLALTGLALFGTLIGVFFTRLAEDLNTLKTRATGIVRGYRGEPLPVTRRDEVGQLMQAVNEMERDLSRREQQLELERQKMFHQDKMAAIGTLAAGIAHEIGNPITAISGIAQVMCEAQEGGQCQNTVDQMCHPRLILDQAARIGRITREISEFAAFRKGEPELLDLNQLVRNTASLMRYDRRFQAIELHLELDPRLPALNGVPDQLTQVVMNLLINSADAFDANDRDIPRVWVSSALVGGEIVMTVRDNGKGMDAETLHRAAEVFFTTKPPGKGTGLGLPLCASVVAAHNGRIRIDSEPGHGTVVSVHLPGAPETLLHGVEA